MLCERTAVKYPIQPLSRRETPRNSSTWLERDTCAGTDVDGPVGLCVLTYVPPDGYRTLGNARDMCLGPWRG